MYIQLGRFDEFVLIFKQHQIYGDALLSLTNDILRDELNIMAYGARHALLKAISHLKQSYKSRRELQSRLKEIKFNMSQYNKLNKIAKLNKLNSSHQYHRKASMSSLCSKASVNTKTSHTYCVGDLNVNNSGDTIPGVDDNWENLYTRAKHGVVDASEYQKQAKLIVKAVTGTTIKLTRNGSGDEIEHMKSGFFEFEDNIPDWNKIESQTAINYQWNVDKLGWDKSYIMVKIAENPFSRGSLRVSYYCLHLTESDIYALKQPSQPIKNSNNHKNKIFESMSVPADVALLKDNFNNNHILSPYFSAASLPEVKDEKTDISENDKMDQATPIGIEHENEEKSRDELRINNNLLQFEENEEKSIPSKESPTFTATFSTKTNLQTRKGDLVARLLGFESRYGGNLIVAKQSIDLTESVQTYFNDVRTQSVSQLFANEYNKYNPPKKVAFIKVKS